MAEQNVFILDIDGHKPFRLELPTSATVADLTDLRQQLDEYSSKVSVKEFFFFLKQKINTKFVFIRLKNHFLKNFQRN